MVQRMYESGEIYTDEYNIEEAIGRIKQRLHSFIVVPTKLSSPISEYPIETILSTRKPLQ